MASPARRRTSSTSSGCRRSTSSASPSAAGWHRSSPCGTRTGCDGWSSPRRPAGSAAFPAHRSRSGCSPRRCGTTRLVSCRRAPAGCTDLSRTRTGGSCTSRCTLAGHDLRRRGDTPSQLSAVAGWTSLPWLHRIGAPTLILTGGKDPIVPPINARILGARIPDATVHVFPDAGHLLLMDHAVQSAELITCFLRSDETHT